MPQTLRDFVSALTPIAEEEVLWLGGAIRLRLRVYLTDALPALEHITSVRAVLCTDDGCAVLRNVNGVPSRLGEIALPPYQRLLVKAGLQLLE